MFATGEIPPSKLTSKGPFEDVSFFPFELRSDFNLSSLFTIIYSINNKVKILCIFVYIFCYGSIFLNTLTIESKNPKTLSVNGIRLYEYLFANIILPIAEAKTGSLIDVSLNTSFSIGTPINTGSLNTSFATSTTHFAFIPPPTRIAHSGSIPSFPIFLSSSLTKKNISS